MPVRIDQLICLAAITVSVLTPVSGADEAPDVQVATLLKNRCAECHAPGTDSDQTPFLHSPAALQDLLKNSSFVDPQNIAQSEILVRVQNAGDPMPPEGDMGSPAF